MKWIYLWFSLDVLWRWLTWVTTLVLLEQPSLFACFPDKPVRLTVYGSVIRWRQAVYIHSAHVVNWFKSYMSVAFLEKYMIAYIDLWWCFMWFMLMMKVEVDINVYYGIPKLDHMYSPRQHTNPTRRWLRFGVVGSPWSCQAKIGPVLACGCRSVGYVDEVWPTLGRWTKWAEAKIIGRWWRMSVNIIVFPDFMY